MTAELTLTDIRKAIQKIKDICPEKKAYEDDFQIIYTINGFPTKIKLKPKGMNAVRSLFENDSQIEKISGIPKIFEGIPIYKDKKVN